MGASTYELVVGDTSPVLVYSPSGDPLAAPDAHPVGWVPYYTSSGHVAADQLGTSGTGQSMHIAYTNGAVVSVDWIGPLILFIALSS
jgi:hypothetical protein